MGSTFFPPPYLPAASTDATTFRQKLEWHRDFLSKTSDADIKQNGGELIDSREGQWAVSMDKGYHDLAGEIRSITFSKKKGGGFLSTKDQQRNQEKVADWIFVKN